MKSSLKTVQLVFCAFLALLSGCRNNPAEVELTYDTLDLDIVSDDFSKKLPNVLPVNLYILSVQSTDRIELIKTGLDGTQIPEDELLNLLEKEEIYAVIKASSEVVFDGLLVTNPMGELTEHIRFLTENQFFFLEIEFPEEGFTFSGVVDVLEGTNIGFERNFLREALIQEKKNSNFIFD